MASSSTASSSGATPVLGTRELTSYVQKFMSDPTRRLLGSGKRQRDQKEPKGSNEAERFNHALVALYSNYSNIPLPYENTGGAVTMDPSVVPEGFGEAIQISASLVIPANIYTEWFSASIDVLNTLRPVTLHMVRTMMSIMLGQEGNDAQEVFRAIMHNFPSFVSGMEQMGTTVNGWARLLYCLADMPCSRQWDTRKTDAFSFVTIQIIIALVSNRAVCFATDQLRAFISTAMPNSVAPAIIRSVLNDQHAVDSEIFCPQVVDDIDVAAGLESFAYPWSHFLDSRVYVTGTAPFMIWYGLNTGIFANHSPEEIVAMTPGYDVNLQLRPHALLKEEGNDSPAKAAKNIAIQLHAAYRTAFPGSQLTVKVGRGNRIILVPGTRGHRVLTIDPILTDAEGADSIGLAPSVWAEGIILIEEESPTTVPVTPCDATITGLVLIEKKNKAIDRAQRRRQTEAKLAQLQSEQWAIRATTATADDEDEQMMIDDPAAMEQLERKKAEKRRKAMEKREELARARRVLEESRSVPRTYTMVLSHRLYNNEVMTNAQPEFPARHELYHISGTRYQRVPVVPVLSSTEKVPDDALKSFIARENAALAHPPKAPRSVPRTWIEMLMCIHEWKNADEQRVPYDDWRS